jgi:uncharacterized damage-inducible protein DinB
LALPGSGPFAIVNFMIRTIADFLDAWNHESAGTLKILQTLTDKSLKQMVTPEGRSLGFIAWHITTSLGEMTAQAGLPVAAPGDKEPMPAGAGAIADAYDKAAKSVAEVVKANWTDAQLQDQIPMYGETWSKGFVLGALIGHQCHHRGQMTVLMRQAGLKVPGVYGPAKEEWANFGMAPLP